MKILHLLAQLPQKTGSGIYFRNVIHRLQTYGHQQRALFALQGPETFDLLEKDLQYPVVFLSPQLPFPIAGMSDVMPYESTRYRDMDEGMIDAWTRAFREQMERIQREFAPDVILSHHLWMMTSLAVEVFDRAVKVGVCHNTDLRQAAQNPGLKDRYVKGIDKLDAVFALSEQSAGRISALYGYPADKIIPIGAGFDETLFHPPAHKHTDGTVGIVYAGKIDRSKGVLQLIQAFQNISRHKSNVRLDIIGAHGGHYAKELEEGIRGHPSIHLIPPMPQQQLSRYLCKRQIFALPSFYEGLGLIALESLASGLLVVASEIEGLMSLLGQAVNRSGAVEYVKMPRIRDTDQPHPEDLPGFVEMLTDKLLLQIERVEQGRGIDGPTQALIQAHSWNNIGAKINGILLQLRREQKEAN